MLKTMTIKLDEYRYIEVLDFADRFRNRFPNSRYLDQANALARTAHLKMRNDEEKKKELAAIRVDQAQRKLFLDEVDEAMELIDTVLRDYPNAPAAGRARQMKQEVLRQRLTRGAGSLPPPETSHDEVTSGGLPSLPGLDPKLLEELDEDAFKDEIQQILKQLEL
jgi:hypothetical protein